ncbi:MAG: SOS response-associated peptidase family protein [Alphaproteobacteria bacterium]|nr:SOS response-associated peptidase family protein [Alphaproteobacteria bacterium]
MCGKFTAMMTWREYCELAGVGTDGGGSGGDAMDPAKMLGTFTPMASAPVLHLGPVRQRRLTPMRWGWIDHKRVDPAKGFSHLHARAETIDATPTWIDAFHETRGVVFGKTFNIGEELPNGKIKQWVCSRTDGQPVALAVLYDIRELPIVGVLKTYVMVTTEACAPLNMRDTRMPAILQTPDEIADWLGETGASSRELKALLRPYDGPLTMREQDPAKPPKPPKEPKPAKTKKSAPSKQENLF